MNGATTIQERLKDLRLNKGLKLEELAEQTGISKSALGSYEKDDYKEINHGNLILLADFYGVSLDYLFCRTENRAEINTPLRELHLSDEMVALLKSGRINNRLLCELATHILPRTLVSIVGKSGVPDGRRFVYCHVPLYSGSWDVASNHTWAKRMGAGPEAVTGTCFRAWW